MFSSFPVLSYGSIAYKALCFSILFPILQKILNVEFFIELKWLRLSKHKLLIKLSPKYPIISYISTRVFIVNLGFWSSEVL